MVIGFLINKNNGLGRAVVPRLSLVLLRDRQWAFAICTVALLWLTFVVHNDWSAVPVMLGLITFGIGRVRS